MKVKYIIRIFLLVFGLFCFLQSNAQEIKNKGKAETEKQVEISENAIRLLNNFKVSGYIQTQFQYGQKDASMGIGAENENKEKPFNRFGVRRGRIKFTYEQGIASGVFQIDLTEKGIGFKDVYLNIKDPWLKTNAFRAGVFDRPFGYEISYSSSRRESPERSRVFQTLFPEERDLGAMLILQLPETSPLHLLKFQGGLFAGNGIKKETDNRKDFIGQLIASDNIGSQFKYGLSASYYNGGVYQGTGNVYRMEDQAFVLDDATEQGKFAKREYFGFAAQLSLETLLGTTELRGEYLFGQQPGSATSSKSPNGNLPSYDTYIRDFSGGYVMLVHGIGKLPVSVVVKYDWYDPNTKIKQNEIGIHGTHSVEAAQYTTGFGALWDITKNIRLQTYYEIVDFEKSDDLQELSELKANLFTMRLQYKF